MPWLSKDKMDCRKELIERVVRGESVASASRACGVSRQTGHKWVKRFKEDGDAGLEELSRAPTSIPHQTAPELVERCLHLRRRYPTWGPKKIRASLLASQPTIDWPAASTIGSWLDKAGLVERRKWRLRVPRHTEPLQHAKEPNDVWSIDFKGQFRLGDGNLCYPLTVTDNASRFILAIEALPSTQGAAVTRVMNECFERFGLPAAIRSDNGSPFASRGPCGFSKVSVQWRALGVEHERIRPGHPEENGRHERMHLTLKQETTRPAAPTMAEQQERFVQFRPYFNNERPHEALGQVPPATIYEPSTKRPDPDLCVEYHHADEVRYVYGNGAIRWGGQHVHVGEAFSGCPVGLREIDDGVWLVLFADVELGLIEKGERKISRYKP